MLIFECPSCNTKMQAAEEHAGKTTVCPACGLRTKIPSSDAAPADAITADPGVGAAPTPTPDAITTPEHVAAGKTSDDRDRDDANDVRRPRRRDGDNTGAAVATGMSVGMIVLIVLGVTGCAAIGVVAVLVALLVPAVQKVREAAARTQTINNMKQIALGIHAYHDVNRKLPSPQMFDQLGQKPMDLSWRVAILPYIEQAPMFNGFDQTNGWDHPNNMPFVNRMPMQYGNLTRLEADQSKTAFQFFTGANTLYPTPQTSPRMFDITDGTSNTFQFAEALAPVTWSKPADMIVGPGDLPLPKDRFLAAMADGSVRMFERPRTSDATLRLAIDPRDGNVLPVDFDR